MENVMSSSKQYSVKQCMQEKKKKRHFPKGNIQILVFVF